MRGRRILSVVVACIALLQPVHAAGTVSATTTARGGGVTEYSLAWVSDASGAVSGNALSIKAGELVAVKFKPDGGGTQPTDLYDVTLEDADNVDLLFGGGANLSNATTTRKRPTVNTSATIYFEGGTTVELVVSNAGNAKGGTVVLWVR